jgi:hypothetical protein
MESLLKELNTTDAEIGSVISHKFYDDEESLQQILPKYDMNILYFVKDNVEKYQTEMLHELVRRRMNRLDNQVNIKAGYDVIEKCLDKIKQIMDSKVIYEKGFESGITKELVVKEIHQQTKYLLWLLLIVTTVYILVRVLFV